MLEELSSEKSVGTFVIHKREEFSDDTFTWPVNKKTFFNSKLIKLLKHLCNII